MNIFCTGNYWYNLIIQSEIRLSQTPKFSYITVMKIFNDIFNIFFVLHEMWLKGKRYFKHSVISYVLFVVSMHLELFNIDVLSGRKELPPKTLFLASYSFKHNKVRLVKLSLEYLLHEWSNFEIPRCLTKIKEVLLKIRL